MPNILLVVCTILLLLPLSAHAEIKTITHTVQQPFGGSQSPDDARTAGIARAKREALERFGTYIESSTVVKNSQVDSDEILALTAGVTKAEVVKQKNYTDGDAFGLEITVKVELDTAVLDKSLKRLLQDRNHLKDLTDARQREKQLLARIAELEKENQQKGKTAKQKEKLKKEFQKTRDGLTAVEWFDKAQTIFVNGQYSNPTQAIDYLSKSISLDLSYVRAYLARGLTYIVIEQYGKAKKDLDYVIFSDPKDSLAYLGRGLANFELRQNKLSLADFNQAIRLDPDFSEAYASRGRLFLTIQKYQQAISDYDKAISINPKDSQSYFERGTAFMSIGNEDKACQDLLNACNLGYCEPLKLARQNKVCK